MSREIKFRAWMLHDRMFHWGLGQLEPNYNNVSCGAVMQYTGLTDKKGADIYEGDIVKDSFGGVSVVSWCSNSASFYCKYSDDGLGMDEFGSLLEVIGNIYENPELMDGGL